MKILLAHLVYGPGIDQWYRRVALAAAKHAQVETFCVTLNPPGPRLSWYELDRLWQQRDPKLMGMYQKLQDAAGDCDVLINYNGANIHPQFLEHLPTTNIYSCFDDPESSESLSQPVAAAFDAVFYGNIAARFQYESWGCRKSAFLPIFVSPDQFPTTNDIDKFIDHGRDIDIAWCGEINCFRRGRMQALAQAFPQAQCYGNGWPRGRIDEKALGSLYRRARIGWNVHNTTGPINQRMFLLAANGIMQICDNKTGLGHIFKLGEEVVGFDTIPEAIELTKYYLEHEQERRDIARRAYHRFCADYHPTQVWRRIVDQLNQWGLNQQNVTTIASIPLPSRSTTQAARYRTKDALRQVKRTITGCIDKLSAVTTGQPRQTEHVFDERIALGQMIDEPVNSAATQNATITSQPIKPIHISTIAWAITSLVGPAKTIALCETDTTVLADYLRLDPSRTVRLIGDCQSHTDQSFDLALALIGLEQTQSIDRIIPTLQGLAPRAIIAIAGHNPQEFRRMLNKFYPNVYLYHLPRPAVPWLEPLNDQTNTLITIAQCSKAHICNQAVAA